MKPKAFYRKMVLRPLQKHRDGKWFSREEMSRRGITALERRGFIEPDCRSVFYRLTAKGHWYLAGR